MLIMRGETAHRALLPTGVAVSRRARALVRRGLAHTGHTGGGTGMKLACYGDTILETTTAPRGAYAREEPGHETARSLHTVFSEYPGRSGCDLGSPVLGQSGAHSR